MMVLSIAQYQLEGHFFMLCCAPSNCLRRGDFNVLSLLYERAYSHTKQFGRAESFALNIVYALKWKVTNLVEFGGI